MPRPNLAASWHLGANVANSTATGRGSGGSMRVAVIGSGYVGLVSGACFADFGHVVCCIDKDASKIDALNRGENPIFDPGLKELVLKNARDNRLSFSKSLPEGIAGAEVVLIAVGTPSRRGDG